MHQLVITGVDLDIGNILTFAIGLFNKKSKFAMIWILSKFMQQLIVLNKILKTVVCEYD